MKINTSHFTHYLVLVVILVFGFALFYFFTWQEAVQQIIIVFLGIAYVAWGVWHHLIHDDLHLSVVVEYIMVALIGIVSIISLLYWS